MGAGPESGDACFTRADWCSRLLGWRRRFGMWCVWLRAWVGSRWLLWLVYARVGLLRRPKCCVLVYRLSPTSGIGWMESFVSLGFRPKGWDMVPSQHPFLVRGAGDCMCPLLMWTPCLPCLT